MIDEAELELFARHVSLEDVGVRGVEALLTTKVRVMADVVARETLVIALARSGIEIVQDGADIVVEQSAMGAPNVVDFTPGHVDIGSFELTLAQRLEASAALAAKERWLGALLASEIVLTVLGKRPPSFTLVFDYPCYALRE